MARYLIKVSRSADLYMIWSTVVDNAIDVITRREAEAEGVSSDLIDRADKTGTSGRNSVGGWNAPYLTVVETEVREFDDDFLCLLRKDFEEYANCIREGKIAEAETLLVDPTVGFKDRSKWKSRMFFAHYGRGSDGVRSLF